MDNAPGFIRRRGTDVDTRCCGGGFAVGVCFDSPRLGQKSNELTFRTY